MGQLTTKLRPPTDESNYHGSHWFIALSKALGPRRWLFHKAVHFVQLYPTKKAPEEQKDIGVDWTRVFLSFSIRDAKKRHALLREASRKGWTIPAFQLVMLDRSLSPQPGIGGRPRHTPGHWGPAVCLRQMKRLIEGLMAFYAGSWKHIEPAQWRQFVKKCAKPEQEELLKLLTSTEDAASELADAGADMRKLLTELRKSL